MNSIQRYMVLNSFLLGVMIPVMGQQKEDKTYFKLGKIKATKDNPNRLFLKYTLAYHDFRQQNNTELLFLCL